MIAQEAQLATFLRGILRGPWIAKENTRNMNFKSTRREDTNRHIYGSLHCCFVRWCEKLKVCHNFWVLADSRTAGTRDHCTLLKDGKQLVSMQKPFFYNLRLLKSVLWFLSFALVTNTYERYWPTQPGSSSFSRLLCRDINRGGKQAIIYTTFHQFSALFFII